MPVPQNDNDLDATEPRYSSVPTGILSFVITLIVIAVASTGWLYATGRIPTARPISAAKSPPVEEKNIVAMDEPASKPGQMWVTTERAERYTCPATDCGVVGKLFFREAANVLEGRDGYARITEMYDAACEGGKSPYVDSGNAECASGNGVVNGKFAEWVLLASLSEKRPPDPAATAAATEKLVAESDDFSKFRAAFVKGASKLIASGDCTEQDFVKMGGWVKSTNQGSQPVYFTYCGGGNVPNRWYLNVMTGATYR